MNQPINRIGVGLDGSSHSLATLRSAAGLAARLGAELHGLFVEEEGILRSALVPAGTLVVSMTGQIQGITFGAVERQMRAQATLIKATFEHIADAAGVVHSFQVVRGRVGQAVCASFVDVDLIALGHTGWSPKVQGSSVDQSLAMSGKPVLLARKGTTLCTPVVVIADSVSTAEEAIGFGSGLAAACNCPLTVVRSSTAAATSTKRSMLRQGERVRVEQVQPSLWPALLMRQRATYVAAVARNTELIRSLVGASGTSGSPILLLPGDPIETASPGDKPNFLKDQ